MHQLKCLVHLEMHQLMVRLLTIEFKAIRCRMVISDLIYLTKLFIYSVSDGCKKKMGEKKLSRKKMDKRKKFVF